MIKYIGRKFSYSILAPSMSSSFSPRIFILDFLRFYMIKLISFIKQNVLVSFSAICAWNTNLYWHSLVPKCEFKIVAPAVSPIKSMNLNSWFSPILLRQFDFFYKQNVCCKFFSLREIWAHMDIFECPNVKFKCLKSPILAVVVPNHTLKCPKRIFLIKIIAGLK